MFTRNASFLGVLAGAALAFSLPAHVAAQSAPQEIKNIVLVHGALVDGSSWSKVIPLLEAKGYHVTAVQNPLTSLAADVATTQRALALQDGPALLVGHSYGGMVITEAGNDAKVAGLVYVAAAAPDAGQSFGELSANAPTPGAKELKPDAAGFLSITQKGVNEDFAPDATAAERKVMFSTQHPLFGGALGEKVSAAAWQTKPSFYVVASQDRMISPDLERTMAKKIKATTKEFKSGHAPMTTHPAELAAFIIEAAKKTAMK